VAHAVLIEFAANRWPHRSDAANIQRKLAAKETMMRIVWPYAVALALCLGGATTTLAETEAEFDGYCTMGLALGKEIKTDCSINAVIDGKTYCFGNEDAKTVFLKKPEQFLDQAAVFYMSKKQAQ
jgi:YHS domain-containing protein